MLRVLLRLIRPFATIARELTIIRELYELDLGSRKPPVYRYTGTPRRGDTEVYIPGELLGRRRAWAKNWGEDPDEILAEDEDES